MMLPRPGLRADAVGHYGVLLREDRLPSDALCLTAVRGLRAGEAMTRFDAADVGRPVSLPHAGEVAARAYPDRLPVAVVDELQDWTVLLEPDGYHGHTAGVLERLSAGTIAVSAYWSVDGDSSLGLAADGCLLYRFDFVLGSAPEGAEPDAAVAFLAGLDFTDPFRNRAEALTFVERVSGVRLTAQWTGEAHPAAVIVEPGAFAPDFPRSWLDVLEPDLADQLPHIDAAELYARAAQAALEACRSAGVDEPEMLQSLRQNAAALPEPERVRRRGELNDRVLELHKQVLMMRWARCQPPDDSLSHKQHTQLSAARRRGEPIAERAVEARAYALGAAAGSLADDPADALALALRNASLSDHARGTRSAPLPKPERRPGRL